MDECVLMGFMYSIFTENEKEIMYKGLISLYFFFNEYEYENKSKKYDIGIWTIRIWKNLLHVLRY